MAERNVALRLSANVSQYMAAMAKAATATRALGASKGDLTQLGGAMQTLGKTMTLGVTVPLLGLGAGAVAMAAKFDTAFAQMVGLANVPAGEVDALKESVLSLAGETAQAPQELAEGLYFAASAGLDSAAAMDVLEMSARASAAGMGSTADVVNLVTGAIAAYGEDNITAAQATDILTATIREGKAEPTELAAALGRITPIAASMGISFDEVGGAAAFMSNIIGDTDETITALRGALLAMLDPSLQGRKTLEDMGTSFEELQAAIAQDGLLGALDLLRTHGFAENSEAMSNLFEDNRALVGATILLEDATGDLVPTIDAVTNSAGAADEAFKVISDTSGFKMKQAMTDIKVAMIEVGEVLLPIVGDIASGISGLIGWFSNLNPMVQTVVGAFVGLAAAAGPVIFIAGSLVKNWTALTGAFASMGGASSVASKALGAIGIAAAVAFIGYQAFTAEQKKTDEVTRVTSQALLGQFASLFSVADQAGKTAGQIDAVALANEALSLALGEGTAGLVTALGSFNMDADNLMTILGQMDQAPVTALDNLARSFGFTAEQADVLAHMNFDAFGLWRTDLLQMAEAAGIADEDFLAFGDAVMELQFQMDNVDVQAIARNFLDAQVAVGGYSGSLVEAAETQAHQTRQTGDALAVLYAWTQQLANADDTTRDSILTSQEYKDAIAALPPEMRALIEGTEGATGATAELEDVQASSIDTMSRLQEGYAAAQKEYDLFADALDRALGNSRNWVRAHDDFAGALLGFSDATDDSTDSLDYNTEAGLANRDAVFDLADGLIELTKSNIDSGKSQEEVNAEYEAGRKALLDTAEAAGLNRGEVEDLITAYGLTPELISTTVELKNTALSQWRIEQYIAKLDGIDPEIATAIMVAIDNEDWVLAQQLLDSVPDHLDVNVRVHFPALPRIVQYNGQVGYDYTGGQGAIAVAGGGYFDRPTPALIGEAGDEVVLPLGNPARMSQLLGMSEVGPRVAAALGNLMPAPSMPAAPSGGSGVHIETVNVGSRQDLPDVFNEMDRLAFLARV